MRHNLYVLHIEKKICVIGTLLDIPRQTKGTLKSQLDLHHMGLQKPLHPIENGDKYLISPKRYTMLNEEKVKFCQILKDVKYLDAYVSNIG